MHCLEVIVERNANAVVNEWHLALAAHNLRRCDEIAYANSDLFERLGPVLVPKAVRA